MKREVVQVPDIPKPLANYSPALRVGDLDVAVERTLGAAADAGAMSPRPTAKLSPQKVRPLRSTTSS